MRRMRIRLVFAREFERNYCRFSSAISHLQSFNTSVISPVSREKKNRSGQRWLKIGSRNTPWSRATHTPTRRCRSARAIFFRQSLSDGAGEHAEAHPARALTERLIRRLYEKVRGDRRELSARHVEQVIRLAAESTSGKRLRLPGRIAVERVFDDIVFSRASQESVKQAYDRQHRAAFARNQNGSAFVSIYGGLARSRCHDGGCAGTLNLLPPENS